MALLNVRRLGHGGRTYALACVVAATAACSSAAPPQTPVPRTSGPIPVARPFAFETAGSHAEFEVVLPDARLDGWPRDVFIGLRAIHDPHQPDPGKRGPRIQHYLQERDIPVRLKADRRVGKTWHPVTLVTMHIDDANKLYEYRSHPDPIFRRHRPANWDSGELLRAGLWDVELAYFEHEIAGIRDPVAGRYRISITNLQSHPELTGAPYEVVVAHSHIY